MVERGRWMKPKVVYEERKCSLCNSGDLEDEYHVSMICSFFEHVRIKYIKLCIIKFNILDSHMFKETTDHKVY